jgi:hypothetical protein
MTIIDSYNISAADEPEFAQNVSIISPPPMALACRKGAEVASRFAAFYRARRGSGQAL